MSTPIQDNRSLVLAAASRVVEAEGFAAVTTSRVADESGFSRQWLHSLFGSHAELLTSLCDSWVQPWLAAQVEVIASRLALDPTLDRSFTLLLDAKPCLGITLRHLSAGGGRELEVVHKRLDEIWAPVWRGEQELRGRDATAATTAYLSISLGLEQRVRMRGLSPNQAKRTLLAALRGVLA